MFRPLLAVLFSVLLAVLLSVLLAVLLSVFMVKSLAGASWKRFGDDLEPPVPSPGRHLTVREPVRLGWRARWCGYRFSAP
ncbi:hypothetical protein GCM10020229_57110 [Kitasatospora albolonga]